MLLCISSVMLYRYSWYVGLAYYSSVIDLFLMNDFLVSIPPGAWANKTLGYFCMSLRSTSVLVLWCHISLCNRSFPCAPSRVKSVNLLMQYNLLVNTLNGYISKRVVHYTYCCNYTYLCVPSRVTLVLNTHTMRCMYDVRGFVKVLLRFVL